MIRRFLAALALVSFLLTPAFGANSVDSSVAGVVRVYSFDGSTTFELTASQAPAGVNWANGVYLTAILVYPSAASDITKIRTGSDSGTIISSFKSIDGGPQVLYFDGTTRYKPFIVYADQSWDTPGSVEVYFYYKR